MALVTIGRGERTRAEVRVWHEAMDAYRAAFPVRNEIGRTYHKVKDGADAYGLSAVERFRGWRDLMDPRSPGYASNQAHLARRARAAA